MKLLKPIMLAFLVTLFFACENESVITENQSNEFENRINQSLSNIDVSINTNENLRKSGGVESWMASVNESISEHGIQLEKIEYYAADGAGNTVYFNNRGNKQLGADFVPGDSRRGGFLDIAYARDGIEGATSSGLTQGQTDNAILSAMNTWDNVTCSDGLVLTNIGASPWDLGYVEALVTGGAQGSFFFTDVMHSGFNTTVTDAVFGPGSNVLGVTFTFVFTGTDIDNNGKGDVAFRDIYYNDSYSWAIGNNVDVETVVLHEAGHGLSQGHFGKLFKSNGNDKFHFAPRAVMNAGYTGIQTSIGATDNAGHCSNWGEWPNN